MRSLKNFNELMRYAGKHKALTYLSWILSAVSALLALVPFVYIWLIIKEVIEVMPDFSQAENLVRNGWCAVAFALASMVVYFGALMCSHLSAFRVATNIRIKAMKHIATLPVGAVEEMGSGKMRSIVADSSAATETYLAHQLPDMAGALATPVGMLVLLFVFDWRLGLLSLVPTVLGFCIMARMTGKKMEEKMREYNGALADMNNQAVEYVRGIPVVKTFSQTVFSFKRFKGSIDNYYKWVVSYTKSLMMPMVCFTTAINAVFALLIGAALIITRSSVQPEFLQNFLFYVIFTPIISVTLMKVMYMSENGLIVNDALERIHSVFALKPLTKPEEEALPDDNSIEFKNVSFKYSNADGYAVKNVSFRINQGERVALVGESGGGKTTVAGLISRFWDVEQGEALIGGVNVKNIAKEQLSDRISYVFQDSKLLKTSVFENVRLAKPHATRSEVMNALEAAQCAEIIEKLPNGIDTVIGADGVYLSGGEQQRIAIARLILKDAPIVVLDEATAFADPENEVKVQKAFEKLSEGKTVVTIAHRLSTVEGCGKIYVLKGGEIAESGSHEELLAMNGEYAAMYRDYMTSIEWKVTSSAGDSRPCGGEEC